MFNLLEVDIENDWVMICDKQDDLTEEDKKFLSDLQNKTEEEIDVLLFDEAQDLSHINNELFRSDAEVNIFIQEMRLQFYENKLFILQQSFFEECF